MRYTIVINVEKVYLDKREYFLRVFSGYKVVMMVVLVQRA
jgi:hypothetical protein